MDKEMLHHLKVLRTKQRKEYAKEMKKEIELYEKTYNRKMSFYAEDYDPMKRDIGIDFVLVDDLILFISTVDLGYSSTIESSRYETMVFLEGETSKETRLPNSINEFLDRQITYTSREEAEEGHKKIVSIIHNIANLKQCKGDKFE